MPAKFPEGGVDVADIDDVAGGVVDLDPVAHPVGPPHEDVNPIDETGHGRLHGKTEDDRDHPDGYEGGIPIDENNRDADEQDEDKNDQSLDPLESETSRGIGDAGDAVERDGAGKGEENDDNGRAAEKTAGELDLVLGER